MFKYAVIILLILIIYNLIMGFVYILKDKSSSKRGLTSLKTRIVLSLLLFILLIVGFYADLIKPNSL
jgi:succinate dehydrogenase/fumarate reductase cytochrome b subunit